MCRQFIQILKVPFILYKILLLFAIITLIVCIIRICWIRIIAEQSRFEPDIIQSFLQIGKIEFHNVVLPNIYRGGTRDNVIDLLLSKPFITQINTITLQSFPDLLLKFFVVSFAEIGIQVPINVLFLWKRPTQLLGLLNKYLRISKILSNT